MGAGEGEANPNPDPNPNPKPEPQPNPNPNLNPNPKPNPIPNQVNALLCVAIFGRPCFAARAEDAKAADVIALVPWKAAGVLALIIASEVMLSPSPSPQPQPQP